MEFTPAFFAGGLTCIDFCNTYDHLHTPPAFDFFPDRAAALQWGQAAGILPPDLRDIPKAGGQSLPRLVKARELIFRLLAPFTHSASPAETDLELFNTLYQQISGGLKVVLAKDGYALICCSDDPLEKILCEAVCSTADLLLSNRLERVKQCQECGWLFYDSTRNQSRRWCDMKICGNKAKARRHYERVKQQKLAAI